MALNVLLGEVRCQFFISIVVVVSQVILYLTGTHQKNLLPEGRDPGNPGDHFWLIPRAIARSDPLEDEDSGRRERLLSGFYDCLSFSPFPLTSPISSVISPPPVSAYPSEALPFSPFSSSLSLSLPFSHMPSPLPNVIV